MTNPEQTIQDLAASRWGASREEFAQHMNALIEELSSKAQPGVESCLVRQAALDWATLQICQRDFYAEPEAEARDEAERRVERAHRRLTRSLSSLALVRARRAWAQPAHPLHSN